MVVFSMCMFLSDGLLLFWLFLELGTLSLVPCFFYSVGDRSLGSLFNYLIVSSLSSSMIVSGVLFEEMAIMVFCGIIMKFGVFPFFGWVYKVVLGSNWLVMWGFSMFLKFPFAALSYFFSVGSTWFMGVLGGASFIVLSLLFWVYTFSWVHCWCHMMLSSSVTFVAMSTVISLDVLFWLFTIYFVWGSLVILFFSRWGGYNWKVGGWFMFCFLLLSFPGSLGVFYKMLMAVKIYSCSFFLLFCWGIYSMSEQLYLLISLVSRVVPRELFSVSALV